MSLTVVDSGIAVKWFITEPDTADALRVFNAYLAGRLEMLAPDWIAVEVANIVWKYEVLRGMAAADAAQVLTNFRAGTFRLTPAADLLDDAYRLAVTYKRTVYDSRYPALAQREQCPFVTADQRLANAVSGHLANVVWLGQWP
jgi:predicted nucleic acid-binding protein